MTSNCFRAGTIPILGSGVFQMGYVFKRGDLPIYITDLSGNPVSPAVVSYTLYRLVSGNPNPIQVGAANRRPVNSAIGEYYVSGVAGEFGQPGEWMVRWQYQENIDSPLTEDIYPYQVLDTSQLHPVDSNAKFGWD